MTKSIELPLAPCPFCQGQHLHLQHRLMTHTVVCQSCHSQGPHRRILTEAIESWNTASEKLAKLNGKGNLQQVFH